MQTNRSNWTESQLERLSTGVLHSAVKSRDLSSRTGLYLVTLSLLHPGSLAYSDP